MSEEEIITSGTLEIGEVHPAAHNAFRFVKQFLSCDLKNIFALKESLASCAIEGNRTAEVCGETLNRILSGMPVSDRYVLGLAWFLKEMQHMEEKDVRRNKNND